MWAGPLEGAAVLFNAAEAAARITLTREMLRSMPARFGAHAAAAATSLDALSTLEMRDLALAKRCHLRHSAQLSGQAFWCTSGAFSLWKCAKYTHTTPTIS